MTCSKRWKDTCQAGEAGDFSPNSPGDAQHCPFYKSTDTDLPCCIRTLEQILVKDYIVGRLQDQHLTYKRRETLMVQEVDSSGAYIYVEAHSSRDNIILHARHHIFIAISLNPSSQYPQVHRICKLV